MKQYHLFAKKHQPDLEPDELELVRSAVHKFYDDYLGAPEYVKEIANTIEENNGRGVEAEEHFFKMFRNACYKDSYFKLKKNRCYRFGQVSIDAVRNREETSDFGLEYFNESVICTYDLFSENKGLYQVDKMRSTYRSRHVGCSVLYMDTEGAYHHLTPGSVFEEKDDVNIKLVGLQLDAEINGRRIIGKSENTWSLVVFFNGELEHRINGVESFEPITESDTLFLYSAYNTSSGSLVDVYLFDAITFESMPIKTMDNPDYEFVKKLKFNH